MASWLLSTFHEGTAAHGGRFHSENVLNVSPRSKSSATHPNERDASIWSRLFRPFTIPNPMVRRCLPKIKSGRLLLELDDQCKWKSFEVVLAGCGMDDVGLYYYAEKSDEVPVGCVPLHSAHVDVLEEVVMVVTPDKTWFLCAEHGRDANEWSEAICGTIERLAQSVLPMDRSSILGEKGISDSTSSNGSGSGCLGSGKRCRLSSHASMLTLREIQLREPISRVDEFLDIFVRSSREDVCLQALEGAFSWSCMRNIAWKLWLDYLPGDLPFGEWIDTAHKKRATYTALRQQHSVFQGFCLGTQSDEDFISSCETVDENLLYTIFKDVRRTRGAMEFFRDAGVQCMLIRILYTYSHAHAEISYNQGMGELLATILYLLHVEQWPKTTTCVSEPVLVSNLQAQWSISSPRSVSGTDHISDETDSDDASYVYVESFVDVHENSPYLDRDCFLRLSSFAGGKRNYSDCCRESAEEIIHELTHAEYIEHDAYLLLEAIMLRMAGMYCPEITTASMTNPPASPDPNVLPSPGSPSSNFTTEMTLSPLYEQMNSIHHRILSRCDPPTARHLAEVGVEPQMIMLRWLRVLMSREFHMPQVWQIWDAIFSITPSDFSFINLLCVAAVREYREEILQADDATAVLLLLRDLSDKVSADRLVENARDLHDALMIAAAVETATMGSNSHLIQEMQNSHTT